MPRYLFTCNVLGCTVPKASQERIAQLRRKMSNQANEKTPVPTMPGAAHVAQQCGHFSAGNPPTGEQFAMLVPPALPPAPAPSAVATTIAFEKPRLEGSGPVPVETPLTAQESVEPTQLRESQEVTDTGRASIP